MNTKAVADAILKISEGFAELGYAVGEIDQPRAGLEVSSPSRAPRPVASPPPSFDELPPEDDEPVTPPAFVRDLGAPATRLPARKPAESAFTKCPAHDKEWTDGKFGPYCTAPSEDPNWSNDKGYCRVTPRSAGAWLKQHPRAAA